MWLFSQARSPFGVKIIKQGAELASPQTSFGVRLSRIHECVLKFGLIEDNVTVFQ